MPLLIIYGVPDENDDKLIYLMESLKHAIINIQELKLKNDDISFFFPKNILHDKLGKEIIIFVEGLLDKPERTEDVRESLALEIVRTTRLVFRELKLVECFIHPFKQENGFHSFPKSG